VHVMAESHDNDRRLVLPAAEGGIGLDAVWSYPRRVAWEEPSDSDGPDFSCQTTVACPRFRDTYGASTGSDDPGGVLRHYDVGEP